MFYFNPKTVSRKIFNIINEALATVHINCLFAHAVIYARVDGIVILDSLEEPKSFYIRHPYGMSLLFGKTDNAKFTEVLWEEITRKNWGTEYLQVFPIIKKSHNFPGTLKVSVFERVNFKFNKQYYINNKKRRIGIRKSALTTHQVFHKLNGTVVPKKFWRNANEFGKLSIGMTVFEKGEALATAFAAFIANNYLELGIETKPEHRGKNLAYSCCLALIEYCIKNKLEPVWACRKDNIGSYKLAIKLGFEPTTITPYYELQKK